MGDSARIGIIGCGRIAQVAHLPAAVKATGIELVAVCDSSEALAKGVGERYAVSAHTSVTSLLEEDIDAVVVATPDRLHVEHARAALESGRHVLVEKPLAPTSAEAVWLGELAAARDLVLQVGAMKRHDPGLAFAREAVKQIGRILSVSCWYRVMASLRPPTEATLFPALVLDLGVRAREAAFKADRGRYLLMTHGVHVFDSLRCLAGDVKNLSALISNIGDDYAWHGTGQLVSGGLVSFELVANAHADWSEGFALYGELGAVQIRSWFPFYRRASETSLFLEATGQAITPAFGDADPYERQLEAFARAVLDGSDPDPGAEDGAAAIRLVEATAMSTLAGGHVVTL